MIDRIHFMQKVRPFIGTDVIKVITGMRRCGKSVFLSQIQNEIRRMHVKDATFVSISLEDDENSRFLKKGVLYDHVNRLLKANPGKMVYVFLDEIHQLEKVHVIGDPPHSV